MIRHKFERLGVIALALLSGVASAAELTPQQVFRVVSPSVVVIQAYGEGDEVVASGSGVVVPSRKEDVTTIATNCHVVDSFTGRFVGVTSGGRWGIGWVTGRDPARDLCIVDALIIERLGDDSSDTTYLKLPAVTIASSQWLEVGDPVFAVGAPQGLELSFSNGLISGFREYQGADYIQMTTPISQGSSGGGLFDAQGRLVGITTMYVPDAQTLNFAVPAEWIASVPQVEIPEPRTTSSAASPPVRASGLRRGDDRWIYVSTNSDDGDVFVDSRSMSRTGSVATVWWKVTHASPITDDWGDTYDESTTLSRVNCSDRTLTPVEFVQRLDGKIVYSRQYPRYEQRPSHVQPDTVGESLLETVCRL